MAHPPQPRRLTDLLDRSRGMTSLLARSRYHAKVQRLVQRRLPSFLAEHCLACVVNDEHVTVYTDSPVWATQLRFALPAVLGVLQNTLDPRLRRVQVHILCPHPPRRMPAERQPRVPGHSVIRQLQDAANCSTPELRTSLLRLAATWRRLRG